jgi:hypothetical protein
MAKERVSSLSDDLVDPASRWGRMADEFAPFPLSQRRNPFEDKGSDSDWEKDDSESDDAKDSDDEPKRVSLDESPYKAPDTPPKLELKLPSESMLTERTSRSINQNEPFGISSASPTQQVESPGPIDVIKSPTIEEKQGKEKEKEKEEPVTERRRKRASTAPQKPTIPVYQGLGDAALTRIFNEMATDVDELARTTWRFNKTDFTNDLFKHAKNQRRAKKNILLHALWGILYDRVFCSPFQSLGPLGRKYDEKWRGYQSKPMLSFADEPASNASLQFVTTGIFPSGRT